MRDRDSTEADFEAFVAARGTKLLRTAYLLTGDHGRAEDLVQTALAKAWPRWGRIDSGGREGYVRRVMVTTYISWWRRRWNGEYPTRTLPEPAVPVRDLDRRHDLLTALAALPTGQRAVIVLRYFDDLSEAQTAEVLGCVWGRSRARTRVH